MKTKLHKKYLAYRQSGNIIIKLAVVAFTIVFLYDQLFYQKDISSVFNVFSEISTDLSSIILLLIAVILMPINIILESIKWKYLINKLEKISLLVALKGVLAGISVSMIMPNRVGDYLGRVFILKKADRLQAVLSTILGSLSQLVTTMLFGLISLIFYYTEYVNIYDGLNFWLYIGIILVGISLIFTMILAYLNFSVFSIIIKKISGRYYNKIEKYAQVFSWYSQQELLNVLFLSMFRYAVFSLQFFLLLHFFGISTNYVESMMLIAVIYIFMAIIPTIALTEIGVRGSVSLYVFQHHIEALGIWSPEIAVGVVSASSLLWIFNLVFPAIVGTIFVFSLRFFRKSNGN
ncbi:MAG: flippase-like domain-containing protein [Bacteroidetes bacterium]|nr:flippase-like domain-containing protein [Bacteroidota bacterium]MBL6942826.1 flippase-like domain-containing protein [Bacteroidales bacterium]